MPTPIAVDHLVAGVLEDVAARESRVSFQEVKARSRDMESPRDVRAALLRPGCSVITELKRASTVLWRTWRLPAPRLMCP